MKFEKAETMMDQHLEILAAFLIGVLAKITGHIWDVKSDKSFPDFLFSCQLRDCKWETGPHEYGYYKETEFYFVKLTLDAMAIADRAEKEGIISNPNYSIMDVEFMRKNMWRFAIA